MPFIRSTRAAAVAATSYTTSFAATENPISESGIWLNGATDGTDWNDIQTVPGKAYAAAIDTAPSGDRDPCCQLKRSFLACTSNQYSQGTVFRVGGYSPSVGHEVTLLVNMTITAGSITGYECYVSHAGSHQMVRWDGAQGSYTVLASNNDSTATAPADGDVNLLTNVGGLIRFYQNGVLRTHATDTTYTGGNPGFGNNPSSGSGIVVSSIGYSTWTGGNM